ncbi:MAG: helicase C-terminal domain-containing protein [Chloroflexota bacterium]|nr:helicase C-terminal domain-containing protein [Chloroflexota bacterium]
MSEIFVSLDLETTGLDPVNDEIIEIGAVKFDLDGEIDTFHSMVRPSRPISYRIQTITGISDRDVEDAPQPAAALDRLAAFVGGCTIVGQNIGFDLAFLAESGVAPEGHVYDIFGLAIIVMPTLPDYRLATIAAAFDVSSPQYHRALADAVAARDVFLAVLDRLRSFDAAMIAELDRLGTGADWPLSRLFRMVSGEVQGDVFSAVGDIDLKIYGLAVEKEPRLSPISKREALDIDRLTAMLENGGAIAASLPQFERREEQTTMMRAVAEAFNGDQRLIVEAGTGTGKSIAYLLPSIVFAHSNGVPVVVSTNTINLQEQLIGKDIPDLASALPEKSFRYVQLKGRNNYLCMRRWNLLRRGRDLIMEEASFLARMMVWLSLTESGDRSELSFRRDDQSLWGRINAQAEGCLGPLCPYQRDGHCFLYRARKRAESAHIIVVNHALLLSEVASGSNILPQYCHLIIDEAHNIEEEATEQWGFEVGEGDLAGYFDRLGRREAGERYGGLLFELGGRFRGELASAPRQREIGEQAKNAYRSVERGRDRKLELFDALWRFMEERADGVAVYERRLRLTVAVRETPEWRRVALAGENMMVALEDIVNELSRLHAALEPMGDLLGYEDLMVEIVAALHCGEELCRQVTSVTCRDEEGTIYWLSAISDYVTMNAAPLEIADVLEAELFSTRDCVVLTGATLSTEGNFDYIEGRLGFGDSREILLGSSFDYEDAALIYIPDDIPGPGTKGYQAAVSKALVETARAAGGRMLALFTSHAALRASYGAIRDKLSADDIVVLGQGMDGSPRQLVRSLMENPRTVILGTASFWEGVDVPGEALSVLAITRLPFNVPTDPVFVSRSELFNDPFNEYAVPQAVLKFKQGFGRLIRSKSDRGAVVLLDSRIRSKNYGSAFISSLPQCTVKSGPSRRIFEEVREWLDRG